MNTRERASQLAKAAAEFPWLGPMTANNLERLVELELGGAGLLDDFQPYGSVRARALAPENLLLILSGATPHATLQAIMRGLLLGGRVRCKLPSGGMSEVGRFCELLPAELGGRMERREDLPEEWLVEADVVVAFGSDDTLAELRERIRPEQRFVGHGHRVSLGLVTADPGFASVAEAAQDASLFDQRGCLSPHAYYIEERGGMTAREYAGRLAEAMRKFQKDAPRQPLSPSEHAAIRELRQQTAFCEANGKPVALWASERDTSWTVIFDATKTLPQTPLNRVILVKPLPGDLPAVLAPMRRWISTVGCWPLDDATVALAIELGASRLCRIGRMQLPSPFWHQDGQPQLASLVRWIDWETAEDL